MMQDSGLTDEERELLGKTADEAIDSSLFQSGTRGIGNDMEDMVENIAKGTRKWTYILVGILIRTLEEKREGETFPTDVRRGDLQEIEKIVEKREDQIRESQL